MKKVALEIGEDLIAELDVLLVGELDAAGVHREDVAELERVVGILGDQVNMQVVHGVTIGTKVDLVRVKGLVERRGGATDVGHEGCGVLGAHAGDVVDVLLGRNDHATLVALLLEQDQLARRQVGQRDAEGTHERVVGAAHAVGAIVVLFHGDSFRCGRARVRAGRD